MIHFIESFRKIKKSHVHLIRACPEFAGYAFDSSD